MPDAHSPLMVHYTTALPARQGRRARPRGPRGPGLGRGRYHTDRPARRRSTVHRQAPCRAVSCRWAAAHPGAASGAWRVSPGAAWPPSQASARPLPQGRARRPSRSAPTTTCSSLTPSGTSRTLAVPSTDHTTSHEDPLRPNAAMGLLTSRARSGAGTTPTGSPAPRCSPLPCACRAACAAGRQTADHRPGGAGKAMRREARRASRRILNA
jgi:hypothetical protein